MIERRVLDETSMEPGALEDNLPQNRNNAARTADTIEQLEAQLRECEQREDYEQAAQIMEQINQLKKNGAQ